MSTPLQVGILMSCICTRCTERDAGVLSDAKGIAATVKKVSPDTLVRGVDRGRMWVPVDNHHHRSLPTACARWLARRSDSTTGVLMLSSLPARKVSELLPV